MKNIDETTLQKIPLSNIDRFDCEIDIFVNKFTQQIFMICPGHQKTISKKRRLEVLAYPSYISLSNESNFSQLKYLSKYTIQHRLLLVHQVNCFHLCTQ